MQSETPEPSRTALSQLSSPGPASPAQYGSTSDPFESPPLSPLEEQSGGHETGSEWSFSTSPGSSEHDAWLNPLDAFLSERALFDDDFHLQSSAQPESQSYLNKLKALSPTGRVGSPIQRCPHEVLLHMLSHLPATDLLTVKLVSRRFHDLVNSPHVWISAFSKHFPGASNLGPRRGAPQDHQVLTTERRSFTRLSPVASWTSEYLLRTKLLRCLARGRPSLPFAAPSTGKPNKGFATFSFYSRLRVVTNLDAKFGPVHDKRLPQFIHGCSGRGTVSISDRRGELSGWGLTESHIPFRTFEDTHPGTAMWGDGRGEVLGVPNVMEVSASHGMVCGEGFPGGHAFFLASNEKHPRMLTPFLGPAHHESGVPQLLQTSNAFCSAWIAKSPTFSRQTQGLVGMLFGSSSGVVTAFSLGMPGGRGQRLERGELTARWLLSPGIPIIAIRVDENISNGRMSQQRIWAVALNSLGELFYLRGVPKQSSLNSDHTLAPEVAQELRAWQTGRSTSWSLIKSSRRDHRPSYFEDKEPPSYYHPEVWSSNSESSGVASEMRSVESWLSKTPADIKARFNGWDMRQRLEVDFGDDDGYGAGESVFVFRCGYEDAAEEAMRAVTGLRYTRCGSPEVDIDSDVLDGQEHGTPNNSIEWRISQLQFGRSKSSKITATAMDSSTYAVTTIEEDVALWRTRTAQMEIKAKAQPPVTADASSAPRIPGQRARFIAAGTSSGQIYVWNTRSTVSVSCKITNEIAPSRIIQTNSPEISSLALSSLYLVHGGSEGLVQAWDPLCSTTHPIRTICSALSRRALQAAQQDPNFAYRNASAVGAICLDPEPGLLRGIVALRGNLRYWSYSSASTTKDISRSQKRRLHRAARGIKSGPSEGFTGGRRVDLKGFVSQEMVERGMEERDKRAEAKQNKRINGRFGLDLLGSDASEEELIAYARLLSEEEQEKEMQKSTEKRLDRDASEAEVEAHVSSLSFEDYEKWKYASWEDRFHMPTSEPSTVTRTTPVSTPIRTQAALDDDLAKAMQLSLEETQGPSSASSAHAPNRQEPSDADDIAEAIRRSLGNASPPPPPIQSTSYVEGADEDIAEAIRLSLQDQAGSPSSSLSPSGSRSQSLSATDEDDFPALGSSPLSSPPPGAWGKGKRRA